MRAALPLLLILLPTPSCDSGRGGGGASDTDTWLPGWDTRGVEDAPVDTTTDLGTLPDAGDIPGDGSLDLTPPEEIMADGAGNPDSPGPGTPDSVYDLQDSDSSRTCTGEAFVNLGPVSFTDVVVTTPPMAISNGKYRGYHVQEKGEGPWSGVLVLWSSETTPPSLKPGDVLDVTGEWLEFYCLSEVVVTSWTLKAEGYAALHAEPVDPAVLVGGHPDGEQWEGVLVSVSGVTVETVDEFGNLVLAGSGLVVDNEFVPDFKVQAGSPFSSITGVVYYSFDTFKLLPRSLDDLLK
ncbi:MAG: hypothetical protein FJ098_07540 [Deltaproteobacteria bacterium]|nr:hypothetical protein [Deltaproteobacteria bacterium]